MTPEEATNVAVEFLRGYYVFPQPMWISPKDATWRGEVDVGIAGLRIAMVMVQDRDGSVASYGNTLPVMQHAPHPSYPGQSMRYLHNGEAALVEGLPENAGEFLWGSLAEALKAVAAQRNLLLRSHAEVRRFAQELGQETDDSTLFDAYLAAEALHSNFYEVALSSEDIVAAIPGIAGPSSGSWHC